MATYTITTTNTNIDTLTTKTGGDTYNVNGGDLVIDNDSRYGQNQDTSSILGNITLSATLGGNLYIKGRDIWLIPYTGGSGNVPAYNTSITKGSASGLLIGVHQDLASAPTTPGSAMPATGYIRVKQWNGTAYGTGALTGITATAASGETYGWIEVCGQENTQITFNGLNNNTTPWALGEWFEVGTTPGTPARSDTYQIPSNGNTVYLPGVFVETMTPVAITNASWSGGVATFTATAHGLTTGQTVVLYGLSPRAYQYYDMNSYITVIDANTFSLPMATNPGSYVSGGYVTRHEFWSTTSDTATSDKVGTDDYSGKVCWISTGGVLRFGNDGTNSTGGALPAAGRKIRIPNIILTNAASGAKTVNTLSGTLANRYRYAGQQLAYVEASKICSNWNPSNTTQTYKFNLQDCAQVSPISLTTINTKVYLYGIGEGNPTTLSDTGFTLASSPLGCDVRYSTLSKGSWNAASSYVARCNSSPNFLIQYSRLIATGTRISSNNYCVQAGNGAGLELSNNVLSGGVSLTTFGNVWIHNNANYVDGSGGAVVTNTNIANHWDIQSTGATYLIENETFPLAKSVPNGMFLNLNTSITGLTIRNIGTAASPIDCGGYSEEGASVSRTTTTATVTTASAHGLRVNDVVYVYRSDNLTPVPLGGKVVTGVPTSTSFTFAATNSGATSLKIDFYASYNTRFANIQNTCANIKIQNCNILGHYSNVIAYNSTVDSVDVQGLIGDPRVYTHVTYTGTNIRPNSVTYGVSPPANAAAITGTHLVSTFTNNPSLSGATGASWSRSSNTITVTKTNHGLYYNDFIQVTTSSDETAATRGLKQVLVVDKDTFTYTGVNAGGTTGTLDYTVHSGRIEMMMNGPSPTSTNYVTIEAGSPKFTGSGILANSTLNDQVMWESMLYTLGFQNFAVANPYIINSSGATTSYNGFDIWYDLDRGSGFSGTYKNLHYNRTGAGGSNGSTNITMTDTTGVAVGDYIFGTGIAAGAKVQSITNSTTIVSTIANVGTVSGTLVFNQGPSESNFPSTGVKFRLRIKNTNASGQGLSYVVIPMVSTSTTRGYLYNQATQYTLTLSGLVSGSDIVIRTHGSPGTHLVNVDSNSGSTYAYTYYYAASTAVDILVYKAGYKNYEINNYTLLEASTTIPIAQDLDPEYL